MSTRQNQAGPPRGGPATPPPSSGDTRGPRSTLALVVLSLIGLAVFAGLLALGTWQVERRAWKLDLIHKVDTRVYAAPVDAPRQPAWAAVNNDDDVYRRVTVHGKFLHQYETFVQATTVLGPGFWVMTPLRRDDGSLLLINRGFVPPEARDPGQRGAISPVGPVTLTGLLRITEPAGGFLRKNVPEESRWYSRDVAAIMAMHSLDGPVAPYFIDALPDPGSAAEARARGQVWPAAGLTVIQFNNHHLVYAITWYVLALMVAGAAWRIASEERRLRRQATLRPNGKRTPFGPG